MHCWQGDNVGGFESSSAGDPGIRATQKALLLVLLEPSKQLREAEANGILTARLALLEEAKSHPWGAVWDEFCRRHYVPAGAAWLPEAESYVETTVRARG